MKGRVQRQATEVTGNLTDAMENRRTATEMISQARRSPGTSTTARPAAQACQTVAAPAGQSARTVYMQSSGRSLHLTCPRTASRLIIP